MTHLKETRLNFLHFFRLLECGVRCHLVLDGAYDGSDMKRATVLSRMREQASDENSNHEHFFSN